jgi:hypothetical protein
MEELLPFGILSDGISEFEDPGTAEDWGGDKDMAHGQVSTYNNDSWF